MILKKTSNDIEERRTIIFGAYYNRDNKKKEPLKWDILDEKDGNALIITHDIIDAQAFDEKNSKNYKDSSIRKWLNNVFYKTAFDKSSKEKIQLMLVDNSLASTCEDNNPYICEDTKDNIFLLSKKEAKTYFTSYDIRQAKGTEYAKRQGLIPDSSNGSSKWWLRSPSSSNNTSGQINCINYTGYLYIYGATCSLGIRPACWIKIDNNKSSEGLKENIAFNTVALKNDFFDKTKRDVKTEEKEAIVKGTISRKDNTITFGSYYNKDNNTKEPLKWDILDEKNGKALIMTQTIINAVPFLPSDKAEYKKIKMGLFKSKEDYFNVMQGVPDGTYTNNYEYSYIRKWLNDNFINTAFNEEEKNAIQISIVDNSISSTGRNKNAYICDNTKDKLFLLSILEANKYFKSDLERQKNGTLYAIKEGLTVNNEHKGCWWLRSPYDDGRESNWACYVGDDGKFKIHRINRDFIGVCPACWIKLK